MARGALIAFVAAAPLLAQRPGECRLEGRICDQNGAPIPAVSLRIRRGEKEVAHTATDAEGMFVAGHLPRAELVIEACAIGHAACWYRLSGWSTDGLAVIELALAAGRRVRGGVVDGEGRPVPRARVVAAVDYDAEMQGEASAAGEFVLDGLPLGAVDVFAWAPGFVTSTAHSADAADTDVQVRLRPGPGTTQRFRVSGATQEQLATARCELLAEVGTEEHSVRWHLPRGATDNRSREPGVWEIGDLPAELRYRKLALHVPGAATSPEKLSSMGDFPPDASFVIGPLPRQVIRGTLSGPDRAPLADIVLEADGDQRVSTRTAADGVFAFELPIGAFDEFTLRAVDLHWVLHNDATSTGRMVVNVGVYRTTAAPGYLHKLEALPAAALHGRVVTPEGAPAAFARVRLLGQGERGLVPVAVTGTDRDGAYSLFGLDGHWPRSYVLEAEACGCRGRADVAHLPTEGDEEQSDIRLEPTATIAGRLLDAGGRPLAGAWIALRLPGESWPDVATCRTDAEGRYRFSGLDPGTYVVLQDLGWRTQGARAGPIRVGRGEVSTGELQAAR